MLLPTIGPNFSFTNYLVQHLDAICPAAQIVNIAEQYRSQSNDTISEDECENIILKMIKLVTPPPSAISHLVDRAMNSIKTITTITMRHEPVEIDEKKQEILTPGEDDSDDDDDLDEDNDITITTSKVSHESKDEIDTKVQIDIQTLHRIVLLQSIGYSQPSLFVIEGDHKIRSQQHRPYIESISELIKNGLKTPPMVLSSWNTSSVSATDQRKWNSNSISSEEV